jgi:site-specific recombinase XerD
MANKTIEIRTKELQDGSQSLYLDIYENGKRHYEFLKLYIVPGKDATTTALNKNAMRKAVAIKAERMLGIERELDEREKANPSERLFDNWMDEYLEEISVNPEYSQWHIKNVQSLIMNIRAYMAHIKHPRLRFRKIDAKFCIGFIEFLQNDYENPKHPGAKQRLSYQTIRLRQNGLRHMLNAAVKQGLLKSNPFSKLRPEEILGKRDEAIEYLTAEEVSAIANLDTPFVVAKQCFLFCCYTGLRHSDISALRWEDIKETDNGLMISMTMQKTKRIVSVPIGNMAQQWLPEKPKRARGLVFAVPSISAVNRSLKKMAEAAGINHNLTFHTSRRTFATLTLAAGGDIYTTSKLLGHTSVNTTQRYAEVAMESKVDAINLFNKAFG